MDTNNYRLLKKILCELQNSSTIPEKALLYLSSPYLSPEIFGGEFNGLIFVEYIRYIAMKQPNGFVTGIWNDILRKTVIYSKYVPYITAQETHIWTWLDEALSTHTKCPNPYIRLELYRVLRIFRLGFSNMNRPHICDTFMYTICEIQPHHLYPSGNVDEVFFGVTDLAYIFHKASKFIFNDNIKQSLVFGEIDDSIEARFVSHFIQIVGVFAVMAGSNPDYNNRIADIKTCLSIFRNAVDILDLRDCVDYLPKPLRFILFHHPFDRHAVETINDLTRAVIRNTYLDKEMSRCMLMSINYLARDLDIHTKTSAIHKMWLSCQVQGSTLVQLRNLESLARDGSEKITTEEFEMNMLEMQHYNASYFSDTDSETSTVTSNSSDSEVYTYEDSSNDSARFS